MNFICLFSILCIFELTQNTSKYNIAQKHILRTQKWCCDDPEALQGHLACTKLFMSGWWLSKAGQTWLRESAHRNIVTFHRNHDLNIYHKWSNRAVVCLGSSVRELRTCLVDVITQWQLAINERFRHTWPAVMCHTVHTTLYTPHCTHHNVPQTTCQWVCSTLCVYQLIVYIRSVEHCIHTLYTLYTHCVWTHCMCYTMCFTMWV